MIFLKSDDFFKVLKEKGIRSKDSEHPNLREFLQLNPENPQLLLLKNIRRTLELMSENEDFMEAIQEDVLANEEKEHEEEILARIERGETYGENDIGEDGPMGFRDSRAERNAEDLATV